MNAVFCIRAILIAVLAAAVFPLAANAFSGSSGSAGPAGAEGVDGVHYADPNWRGLGYDPDAKEEKRARKKHKVVKTHKSSARVRSEPYSPQSESWFFDPAFGGKK